MKYSIRYYTSLGVALAPLGGRARPKGAAILLEVVENAGIVYMLNLKDWLELTMPGPFIAT